MPTILHITTARQWQEAQAAGSYRGDTLDTQGFIHTSEPRQLLGVANSIFRGRTDLVLLEIDPGKVAPPIRYDAAPDGDRFPHIYGPLNLDAVLRVLPFTPCTDSTFALPPELAWS